MHSALYNRLFRTKDGNIVIGQKPNLPIIGWAVCLVLSWIIQHGSVHGGLAILSKAFLFTWAYEELTQGVNLFRKLLGGVVLAGVVITMFW